MSFVVSRVCVGVCVCESEQCVMVVCVGGPRLGARCRSMGMWNDSSHPPDSLSACDGVMVIICFICAAQLCSDSAPSVTEGRGHIN